MGMHGSMAVAQGAAPVQPPSATTESVAAGGSPAGKTFGAFTDPDGAIASYTVGISNAVGSTSIGSGSGLGAYAVTGFANGDSYTLYLNAKNADGDVVATAVHTVDIAAAAATFPDALLDWSSASETFASGEGSYTIGGLSVTYSYQGTAGPDSIALSSGVLTITSSGGRAYLVIDLGEALTDEILCCYVTMDSYSAHTSAGVLWQIADDTTLNHDAGHLQTLVATSGVETTMRFRECTQLSPLAFSVNEDITVTDVSTTPTRMCMRWDGASGSMSWDQGSATLPTDGGHLTNVVDKNYNAGDGAATRSGRRYLHIWAQTSVTLRTSAYKLRAAS